MNTFRTYADYEIPLLQVLSDLPGGQGSAKDVRDRFGELFDDRIPDEHRVFLENVRDIKWRNIVAWVRNTLVKRGLMDAPAYNIWRITDVGRAHLQQAGGSAYPAALPPQSASPLLDSDRTHTLVIGGQSITLSAEQVLTTVRREIARGLPEAAHKFHSWIVEIDGQQVGVKWLFGMVTGMAHADFQPNQAGRALKHLGLTVRQLEDKVGAEATDEISSAQAGELTVLEFIARVRHALDGLLDNAGLKATLKAPQDNLVQVFFIPFSGCHYEVWAKARTIEIALHFESSRKLNYARLEPFLPHEEALSRKLSERVRVEKWSTNMARVYYELSRPTLSEEMAAECSRRLTALIQETLPILRQAFANQTEGRHAEARLEAPSEVHSIVDALVSSIRDFLHGRSGRPGDERLCDWTNFCYEFGLYREGRELFALVDPSQVNPWYYERTRRLAKVCAMKVTGQA